MWHLLKAVFKMIPFVLWEYFAWMIPYSGKKKDKYPLSLRYNKSRKICRRALRYLKVDVNILGKENILKEKACYFANHVGACDPLLYLEAFEEPIAFVGKVELAKTPFVARVFKAFDCMFLDRKDLKQQLRVMMKVQSSLEEKHTNWLIFPEGTRIKDQMAKVATFHQGTFRSVMKAKAPIVPVVNYGSFRFLSMKHSLKKYPAFVKFLTPIYYDEYQNMTTEEIAKLVQSRIQKELSFTIRKLDHEEMIELQSKKYIFNRVY